MNEIVNLHNDLVDLPLKSFNANEIDILGAICHEVQNKKANEVIIDLNHIHKLATYKRKNKKIFLEDIKKTNEKLMNLNFTIEDEHQIVQFVLFPIFRIDKDKSILKVKVNEPFVYLLNELSGNFTSLELQQCSQLNSTYSKTLYKYLKKFKSTGMWEVLIDDFRTKLDIPKSYTSGMINSRVLNIALKELEPHFVGLKCETKYKKTTSGKGRPALYSYKFTFQKEKTKVDEVHNVDTLASYTHWEKIGKYCPKCHKEVYQKRMHNENGDYLLIGHPDFKTGSCNYISKDFSQLLDKADVENLKIKPEPETPEQKENKSRLSKLVSNMFK